MKEKALEGIVTLSLKKKQKTEDFAKNFFLIYNGYILTTRERG